MEEKEYKYTFKVTQKEAEVIMAGLGELQAKFSSELMFNLRYQFAAQVNAQPQNVEETKGPAQ